MSCRILFVGMIAVVALGACSDGSRGGPTVPEAPVRDSVFDGIAHWLQAEAKPFPTADPEGDLDDLEFLRGMIGNAHVVALGEATHGTREFSLMKHRIIRFLVERMGFNVFAIEATWPESNRVNDFVHTGEGDPAALLSGLYFWTWNTQEVLDMILWMRAHNLNPGSGPQVSFFGFDMQFPGMAIHNVLTYLSSVDPSAADVATARYACILPYANNPKGYFPATGRYGGKDAAYRDACREDLDAVRDSLLIHRSGYEAVSSAEEFARAEHSARLVQQYDDWQSHRIQNARDVSMAENAAWLLDQAGSQAKMVVWAHNGHVADDPMFLESASMGYYLRRKFGQDMVIAGFDFYQGDFRAVTLLAADQDGPVYGSVEQQSVGPPPVGSYEYYYHSAGYDRFVLDVRHRDPDAATTSWLTGPRLMRTVGAAFTPNNPDGYLYEVSVPSRYDLIVYFDSTAASIGLPYRPPSNW